MYGTWIVSPSSKWTLRQYVSVCLLHEWRYGHKPSKPQILDLEAAAQMQEVRGALLLRRPLQLRPRSASNAGKQLLGSLEGPGLFRVLGLVLTVL